MKERNFNFFKLVQGGLLFTVNLYLVALSFTSFAPYGTLQFWGWLAVAVIVTTLQLSFIMQIKTELKGAKRKGKLAGLIIGYLLFTIVTFNGSLSFIVTTINAKTDIVNQSSSFEEFDKKSLQDEINNLRTQNEALNKNINEVLIPKNLISSAERVQKLIAENQAQIQIAKEKLEKLYNIKESSQEEITTDTFGMIAEKIPLLNIKGIDYQFFIMILISLGIEFGLFVTTDNIRKGAKINFDIAETKKELNKYIEALFDTDGVRLVSDKKIEEATKIPIKNCMKYKQMLQEQIYNGKPLIYSGRGGTKANYGKDDIIKIMTFALNTQKIDE